MSKRQTAADPGANLKSTHSNMKFEKHEDDSFIELLIPIGLAALVILCKVACRHLCLQ